MARPSKYTAEYLAKAKDYLVNWKEYDDLIPSALSLAVQLNISKATLYRHAEKHKEFRDILDQINTQQELALIRGGLGNEMNANIAKLVLGKHGYHDKQDQNVTQADKPNVSVEFKTPKKQATDSKQDNVVPIASKQ